MELVVELKGVIADADADAGAVLVLGVRKSMALLESPSSRRRHRWRTRLKGRPFCLGILWRVPLDAIANLAPDQARVCTPG